MSTIVWLMYLADVVTGLSVTLSVGALLTLLATGIYRFFSFVEDFDPKPIRAYVIGASAALLIASLLPSKETIYAAAALNAGEKALSTPTGDKAVRALNAWLDRQIAGDGEKK